MIDLKIIEKVIALADVVEFARKQVPEKKESLSDFIESLLTQKSQTPEEIKYREAEKVLEDNLNAFSDDEILDIMAIMYLGIKNYEFIPPSNLNEQFSEKDYLLETGGSIYHGEQLFKLEKEHLSSLKNTKEINIEQVCSKKFLSEHLQRGLDLLDKSQVVG